MNAKDLTNKRAEVIASLKQVYDPELPINIWDLGLVYGVDIEEEIEQKIGLVCTIIMTFTSPNCPSCEDIVDDIKEAVLKITHINSCVVDIVWQPVWNKNNLSEEVLFEIGMYN